MQGLRAACRGLGWLALFGAVCAVVSCRGPGGGAGPRVFDSRGVVREVLPADHRVVIQHEPVAGYMPAMTMPFRVRTGSELAGLNAGDEVTFRLVVAGDESWIEGVAKTGRFAPPVPSPPTSPQPSAHHPLLDYSFTNELGLPMTLGQFKGRALAYTFIFTRCPVPDYCPRLSKNFAEASRKLGERPGAPTNWHFLSITIDPENDTPAVLRNYARGFGYDPSRWNFLTGPTNRVRELADLSELSFERAGATYQHNLRTVIIDPLGRLHKVFPIGGNLSDAIVEEMLKAAAATNR